jgi:hypothetical protein
MSLLNHDEFYCQIKAEAMLQVMAYFSRFGGQLSIAIIAERRSSE